MTHRYIKTGQKHIGYHENLFVITHLLNDENLTRAHDSVKRKAREIVDSLYGEWFR